jgi:anti-sigma regulatory factor (Ser/Thr protein kinase)
LRREFERAALPASLQAIRDFIEDSCRQAGVERAAAHGLVLSVDEACANIVEHGYAGREPGSIGISFDADAARIVMTITDRGRAFDPKDAPVPDLHSGWRERRVGGLGWHLVRQFVDEIHYDTDASNGNRLTLVKRIRRGQE